MGQHPTSRWTFAVYGRRKSPLRVVGRCRTVRLAAHKPSGVFRARAELETCIYFVHCFYKMFVVKQERLQIYGSQQKKKKKEFCDFLNLNFSRISIF